MTDMTTEFPVVYTITPIGDRECRIYTKDSRVKEGDNDLTVNLDKLLNMMTVMSSILNDEGYSVLFEVD